MKIILDLILFYAILIACYIKMAVEPNTWNKTGVSRAVNGMIDIKPNNIKHGAEGSIEDRWLV